MTPEQDALIRQAADLEHATVTAFGLDTLTARAATVIEQGRDVTLLRGIRPVHRRTRRAAERSPELVGLFQHHPGLPEA